MRRILTPGWIAWHLFVLVAFSTCIWAFWWQLSKAESTVGDWQNWLYAIQWPMFGLMGLWGWIRSIWLVFHPPGANIPPLLHDEPDPGRVIHDIRPKAITSAPHYDAYPDIADPELEAYNAHLKALNEHAANS